MAKSKALTPKVLTEEEKKLLLTDAQISKAVKEINDMVAKDVLSTAIKVGNHVIKTFFNNDIQEAMSKDPQKAVSYRDLQRNKELNISFNHLSLMVRIAAQEKLFPEKLEEKKLKLLSYSHRVELLQVDEENKKIALAKKCVDDKLSVRDLRDEIRGKASRNRSTDVIPFNDTLTDILNLYSEEKLSDEDLQTYSFSKIQKIKTNVDEFLNKVDDAKAKLHTIQKKIDPIFTSKKAEAEKPKEKKNLGRPKKNPEQPK